MKKLPGVVQFFQAKDVPGTNNYMEFGIYAGPPSTPAKVITNLYLFTYILNCFF